MVSNKIIQSIKIMYGNLILNQVAPNGKLANDTNVLRSQFETASNAIQNLPKEGELFMFGFY